LSEYDDWVVVEFDAQNMFQNIARASLIKRVAEVAPLMLPSVLRLMAPQHISMFNGKVWVSCTSGTLIGGGNSACPAALLMDVCIDELLAWGRESQIPLEAKAQIDNLMIQCRLKDVLTIFEMVKHFGDPLGFNFRSRQGAPSKLHVWNSGLALIVQQKFGASPQTWQISLGRGGQGPAWSPKQAVEKRQYAGCIKLNGIFFGSDAAVSQSLLAKVDSLVELTQTLCTKLDPQGAFIIYKACVVMKLDYAMRLHCPHLFPNNFKTVDGRDVTLDERLVKILLKAIAGEAHTTQVMSSPEKDTLMLFFGLSRAKGGFGFRTHGPLDCFLANVAGMAAAAVQAIKRNIRAEDALFVFPYFTSYLNRYNSAVNEKNRLGGNTALEVTEFVIRNYGDQAQLLDQQEGFRRRYQARISKIMKSAVTDRQREMLDERLDMGLRRKQLHTRNRRARSCGRIM
jgi:hypothetical protein